MGQSFASSSLEYLVRHSNNWCLNAGLGREEFGQASQPCSATRLGRVEPFFTVEERDKTFSDLSISSELRPAGGGSVSMLYLLDVVTSLLPVSRHDLHPKRPLPSFIYM